MIITTGNISPLISKEKLNYTTWKVPPTVTYICDHEELVKLQIKFEQRPRDLTEKVEEQNSLNSPEHLTFPAKPT